MSIISKIKKSILIFDSAADQCTCGGPAWIVLDTTGQEVRCNGYLKGENGFNGPILPIVHAVTCAKIEGQEPILLVMNQACFYNKEEQDESLCLPFQAMKHGGTFDMTPHSHKSPNGDIGTQRMIIADREIPSKFDGQKMFLDIRRPSEEELHTLESYELTSPCKFNPEKEDKLLQRRSINRKVSKPTPGDISIDEWRKRLALEPEEVVQKTFACTTQLCTSLEAENRTIPRRHFASRFPFLKEKRLNDTFHLDTFFPRPATAGANYGVRMSEIIWHLGN